MPRSRRAARRGTGSARASSPGSEEEAGSEVLSHCSSASESAGPADEGPGSEAASEQGQEEEVEDRLKEHMDNLLDKSAKARQAALQSLRLALSSRTLSEFLLERRLTLTDSLEKCLKKGKGEEQALAGTVLTLLCLQMGSGPEGEEVFRSLKPLLISILTDSTASPSARQSCATALGMCCYIAAADLEDLVSCLSCLEGIFSPPSTGEGGSAPAQHGPLHCGALQSWSLLLTICPPSHLRSILDNRWLQLPPLLTSSSVALRILAGETIALLFELAQDLEVRHGLWQWEQAAEGELALTTRRTCATKIQSSCVPNSRSWLLRATSTEPRQTDGGSDPSSGTSCVSSRVGSTRRRPSDLAWSACTWTAGHASAPTKPLRRCWALASTTTSRTMSCYGRSSASGLPWCWMRLL
ncbi:interferon-related developmental regulator 2 isoform X2 [Serinus canaria]|uniref:interferon-related developmental regulator 2 isoform X2 n=1 Tax=Serinus canaria TaxID=9135 RepID=UPI0021CC75DE|nr:interferon-related developmental regulator 2 isoform X2 [Serinus canaria]